MDNLEQGIKLVNDTGYGLTSALESLNDDEQMLWKNSVEAGNLYINRSSTGAVVERQPFGGMNKSAFGTGIKAGGLNYIYQFFNFDNGSQAPNFKASQYVEIAGYNLKNVAEDLSKNDQHDILPVFKNYLNSYNQYFSQEIDYQQIPGQSNITRFLKLPNIAIRAHQSCSVKDLILTILAAKICTNEVHLSIEKDILIEEINKISPAILWQVKIVIQDNEEFIQQIEKFKRVRIVGKNALDLFKQKAAKTGLAVIGEDVIYQGRVELLHYLQEQSVSNNYHRFGYIANAVSDV
ncbi:MAG: aldehyde dehydrogenase family protein [Rickettsiales bacterium]|nr:aldehyde dehydrogenase family protein [Rickettsiales bacterium]